ncbi:MAG: DUF479 domain-containing protein [Flavobacteriales bacterium]|nr:DUF479 domain-containing protein [Flavobacteriales bacterium]
MAAKLPAQRRSALRDPQAGALPDVRQMDTHGDPSTPAIRSGSAFAGRWGADENGCNTFPNSTMNFLGHLLVSGNAPLVIVGNFMADAVKGRDLSGWSADLQTGIRMHRRIDSFTDNHPLTLKGRERLRPHCGKYAGVALDLFYDHAIASRWDLLNDEPLPDFTRRMYTLLKRHAHLMPDRTQQMLPYMVKNDWLTSYASIHGIARALRGLASRVPAGGSLIGAEEVLQAHYAEFQKECLLFLPELEDHLALPDA